MWEVHRGELYLTDLSPAIGSEQDGVRPTLLIQNEVGNRYSPTVIVAAVTSRCKKPLPTHVRLYSGGLCENSTVLLEQIRALDKRRLLQYLGKISPEDMRRVDQALDISLGRQYERRQRDGDMDSS